MNMNDKQAVRIREQVRRGDNCVQRDKETFDSCSKGEISIERCIELFRFNNNIAGKIPREFMISYMHFLGWRYSDD